MSAVDELRGAAIRLRALAQAATPGPWDASGWVYGTEATESYGVWAGAIDTKNPRPPIAKTSRLDQGCKNASFIAAMHPGVALAVADWLDDEAQTTREPTAHPLNVARVINGVIP